MNGGIREVNTGLKKTDQNFEFMPKLSSQIRANDWCEADFYCPEMFQTAFFTLIAKTDIQYAIQPHEAEIESQSFDGNSKI